MTTKVAQHLPDGYAGINQQRRPMLVGLTSRLTPKFMNVVADHSANTDITLRHDDCGDMCSVTVKVFEEFYSNALLMLLHRPLASSQSAI